MLACPFTDTSVRAVICGGFNIGVHRTRKGPGARPVLWGFSLLQPRK